MTLGTEVLKRLPKTDLHLHLDGSLRPKTVWELAKDQGVRLPAKTPSELSKRLRAGPAVIVHVDYLCWGCHHASPLLLRTQARRSALENAPPVISAITSTYPRSFQMGGTEPRQQTWLM